MKIVFDIDGTLTDFNKFLKSNAFDYFEKKYGMRIKHPDALEIQDIFDMDNFFIEREKCSQEEAKLMTKKALDKFWISYRFIKFSLFGKFRKGVKQFINKLMNEGHDVEIHTSRAKTCSNSLVGLIARNFTFLQLRLNGVSISKKKFFFYENDNDKIAGIKKANPQLVFEDKKEVINALSNNNINCICVDGVHNKEVSESSSVVRISNFKEGDLENSIQKLFGAKKLEYYKRAANSDVFFKKISVLKNIVLKFFNPIILNKENLVVEDNKGILYAPNHRSTLDPIVITGYTKLNIHWAALLRFFKGDDSIFNNSKNPFLCKLTSYTFKKMEYFPIDRKSDNPKANNFRAISDMNKFLEINQRVGIFPEGTTRRPEGEDFGDFDESFLMMAKKTGAIVQPITTFWIKDLKLKSKVILNFGKPFTLENMTKEEAMIKYLEIQKKNLEENKRLYEELKQKVKLK